MTFGLFYMTRMWKALECRPRKNTDCYGQSIMGWFFNGKLENKNADRNVDIGSLTLRVLTGKQGLCWELG